MGMLPRSAIARAIARRQPHVPSRHAPPRPVTPIHAAPEARSRHTDVGAKLQPHARAATCVAELFSPAPGSPAA
eukprot:CAMPEP_0119503570 /NCGR_PEP_ID=MMETSP1344-20130328/24701_1 /TAXON_ID=236787 /ORGANISM="Florenciella parvula, Strain CCMP2471" /LENGTH=73 /DNA_ID=CAMNT_0007539873 /DNA_START=60 /DNA_END=281 /DNA_ORIENTATION=+